MAKLKQAKNYHWIRKRCCANCNHWTWRDRQEDRWYACARSPEAIAGDWNENAPEWHVCDRWTKSDQ